MPSLKSLREELEDLKKDIMAKHKAPEGSAASEAASVTKISKLQDSLEHQITELNRMVKTMLDEAETTVADHPVATVAGALALGIAIGRLTAR